MDNEDQIVIFLADFIVLFPFLLVISLCARLLPNFISSSKLKYKAAISDDDDAKDERKADWECFEKDLERLVVHPSQQGDINSRVSCILRNHITRYKRPYVQGLHQIAQTCILLADRSDQANELELFDTIVSSLFPLILDRENSLNSHYHTQSTENLVADVTTAIFNINVSEAEREMVRVIAIVVAAKSMLLFCDCSSPEILSYIVREFYCRCKGGKGETWIRCLRTAVLSSHLEKNLEKNQPTSWDPETLARTRSIRISKFTSASKQPFRLFPPRPHGRKNLPNYKDLFGDAFPRDDFEKFRDYVDSFSLELYSSK